MLRDENTVCLHRASDGFEVERGKTCCFTGHRPEKLAQTEAEIKVWLTERIRDAVRDGYAVFISGMARGVDLWAAECVLSLRETDGGIRLICASPCEGFETRWSQKWQELYHEIIVGADETVFISPRYDLSCFQKRNEWMVDHSSRLIAVYNGAPGGTRNTVDYARRQGLEIVL